MTRVREQALLPDTMAEGPVTYFMPAAILIFS